MITLNKIKVFGKYKNNLFTFFNINFFIFNLLIMYLITNNH